MAFNRLVTFSIVIVYCFLYAAEAPEYVIDEQEESRLLRLHNKLNKVWLSPTAIHRELQDASRHGKQAIVALLISHTTGSVIIKQYNINYALRSAAVNNHHGIVKLLLACSNPIRPDQYGVNQAFCDVVTYGSYVDMAECLLTPVEGQLTPDDESIANAYSDAVTYGHKKMVDLIEQKVKNLPKVEKKEK